MAVPPSKSGIETIEDSELKLDPQKEIFQLKTDFVNVPELESFPEIAQWFPTKLRFGLLPSERKKGAEAPARARSSTWPTW